MAGAAGCCCRALVSECCARKKEHLSAATNFLLLSTFYAGVTFLYLYMYESWSSPSSRVNVVFGCMWRHSVRIVLGITWRNLQGVRKCLQFRLLSSKSYAANVLGFGAASDCDVFSL